MSPENKQSLDQDEGQLTTASHEFNIQVGTKTRLLDFRDKFVPDWKFWVLKFKKFKLGGSDVSLYFSGVVIYDDRLGKCVVAGLAGDSYNDGVEPEIPYSSFGVVYSSSLFVTDAIREAVSTIRDGKEYTDILVAHNKRPPRISTFTTEIIVGDTIEIPDPNTRILQEEELVKSAQQVTEDGLASIAQNNPQYSKRLTDPDMIQNRLWSDFIMYKLPRHQARDSHLLKDLVYFWFDDLSGELKELADKHGVFQQIKTAINRHNRNIDVFIDEMQKLTGSTENRWVSGSPNPTFEPGGMYGSTPLKPGPFGDID